MHTRTAKVLTTLEYYIMVNQELECRGRKE